MTTTGRDGFSQDLGDAPTRRGVFQLLRRAAAVGVVVATGQGEAATARRRKKACGSRCHSEERCVKGKCVPIDRGYHQ